MANRPERLASLINKNIRDIVQFELNKKNIGLVTITDVVVSPDISYAKVFVTFLGSKYPLQSLEELNKSRGFVRSCLAKKMDTRKVPEITFVYDDSFEKAQRIEKLLETDQKEIDEMKK